MGGVQNNIRQTDNIEGAITVLMKAISNLAPHPDRPAYHGPLFISVDSYFNPPAEYDGMLGSMMLETALSTAFTSAARANDIADYTSTFLQDRGHSASYTIGRRGSLTPLFNECHKREILWRAYYADLPRRLGLEATIAQYMRKLCTARKNALRYAA